MQVTYDVRGFMEKNKDLLFKDLSKAMYACERGLLKELFPEGEVIVQWTPSNPATLGTSQSVLIRWTHSKGKGHPVPHQGRGVRVS